MSFADFVHARESEEKRIAFVTDRDGGDKAAEFVKQTCASYHRAITDPRHFGSNREYKSKFLGSLYFFEKYQFNISLDFRPVLDKIIGDIEDIDDKKAFLVAFDDKELEEAFNLMEKNNIDAESMFVIIHFLATTLMYQ